MESGLTKDCKAVKELMQQIMGSKVKISDEIAQVFRASAKIYCGQLTEEARLVQLEELAAKYGGRHNVPESVRLGPIEPHHLQEARRRIMKHEGVFIEDKPKCMFLRN